MQGARGSTVTVRMSGNLSWGHKQGRLIVNNRAQNSTVVVSSSGNRFFDNGAGTIVIGALSTNDTRADGNTISVDIHGDRFIANTRASEFDHGGLVVIGSENGSPNSGGGSDNNVHVRLSGTRYAGNAEADLAAIGARRLTPVPDGLSQNNHVTIEIRGEASGNGHWQPVEFVADIVPDGPPYGNSAVIQR